MSMKWEDLEPGDVLRHKYEYREEKVKEISFFSESILVSLDYCSFYVPYDSEINDYFEIVKLVE